MWMLVATFFIVFVSVAAVAVGLSWTLHLRARVQTLESRHRQIAETERARANEAAWRANREMIMH